MVSTDQPTLRESGTNAGPARRRRASVAHWLSTAGFGNTERIVLAALILLFFATGLVRPESLSFGNAQNILIAAIPLIIMAVGQVLVVATAGIDLSVGSVFSLTGMVTAAALSHGVGTVTTVLFGLATGLVFGVFNGFCVAVLKLTPFVVTLVTLSVGASLAFIVTGGNSVPVNSPGLDNVYDGLTLGIPNHFFIPLALVVAVQAFLSLAVAGRWVYAVGSNHKAAQLVGIPTRRVLLSAYTASGLCAALAAVLQLSYLSNAEVSAGNGMELQAIAAVVIGGASLFGGRGSALGALLGALIITAIQNTVNLLGINTFWQGTVTGAVILAAVLADRLSTTVRSLREGRAARSDTTRKEAA
jgi:ribose transport system permease protein